MDGPIAEYAEHKGTIVLYPYRGDVWRDGAKHIRAYICRLVEIISRYEDVYLFCDPRFAPSLIDRYRSAPRVHVIAAAYDDIWARDIAPSFVRKGGRVTSVDWRFNAWGGVKEGSYYPWDRDDAFASFVSQTFGLERARVSLVAEGGGIATDGVGTIFTTRSVMLNRNRNPFLKRADVEDALLSACGASRVVWLERGLAFDETDGHIDNVLSFIGPREVLLSWTDDKDDPNYGRVREIERAISPLANLHGDKYIIHRIPLPPLQYRTEEEASGLEKGRSLARKAGDVLPASYTNLYVMNGAVLVPSFGCDTDDVALASYERIFKDREIIQLYSREPLLGGGGIHCLLHEVPTLA